MASGALAALGALTDGWLALALMMGPVMVSAIYLMYFSQREYQRLVVGRVELLSLCDLCSHFSAGKLATSGDNTRLLSLFSNRTDELSLIRKVRVLCKL